MRDRSLSETNNRSGDDRRDNQTTVNDAQTLTTAPEERLPLGDGGGVRSHGRFTSADASTAEVQETDANGASTGVPVEVIWDADRYGLSTISECFNLA